MSCSGPRLCLVYPYNHERLGSGSLGSTKQPQDCCGFSAGLPLGFLSPLFSTYEFSLRSCELQYAIKRVYVIQCICFAGWFFTGHLIHTVVRNGSLCLAALLVPSSWKKVSFLEGGAARGQPPWKRVEEKEWIQCQGLCLPTLGSGSNSTLASSKKSFSKLRPR